MAAKFDQLTLEDKFNNLTGSQESVQSLSRYILTNAIHVKSVVSTLMRELKQGKNELQSNQHSILAYYLADDNKLITDH